MPDLLTALRLLHQPLDESDPQALEQGRTPAHQRLGGGGLFAFALGVALRRAGRMQRRGRVMPTSPALRERLQGFLPFTLTRARAPLTGTGLAKATTATIRRTLITVPARIASSARRLVLHLPTAWPWEAAWTDLFNRVNDPPAPATA